MFASSLIALKPPGAEATIIKRLLQRYADCRSYGSCFVGYFEDLARGKPQISDFIYGELEGIELSGKVQTDLLIWAEELGRRRIDQIVSNKHRGAYDRAAEVLGALAELLVVKGKLAEAIELTDELRNKKYNRFSAFRREIDKIYQLSPALKNPIRLC